MRATGTSILVAEVNVDDEPVIKATAFLLRQQTKDCVASRSETN
jgi:hypothetical protein